MQICITNIYHLIIVFLIIINVGVRASLHVPQLISRVLKLTTI
jgi:hypothetical protein